MIIKNRSVVTAHNSELMGAILLVYFILLFCFFQKSKNIRNTKRSLRNVKSPDHANEHMIHQNVPCSGGSTGGPPLFRVKTIAAGRASIKKPGFPISSRSRSAATTLI